MANTLQTPKENRLITNASRALDRRLSKPSHALSFKICLADLLGLGDTRLSASRPRYYGYLP